ncbi:putative multidrug resistance efflux pump [Yersinia ruckeri]|nr:putative multidrug resistance efflux pump [Yersinia ruckeri]
MTLVNTHAFYMMTYFEEMQSRHIREGNRANIILYTGNIPLQREIEPIDRDLYHQNIDTHNNLSGTP